MWSRRPKQKVEPESAAAEPPGPDAVMSTAAAELAELLRPRSSVHAVAPASGSTGAADVQEGDGRSRPGFTRRASVVLLAVVAALAGGITTDRTDMLGSSSDGADEAADTSELGGFLPVQEEELEMELAAFEDPEFLEDVPVSEGEVSDEVEEVLESAEVVETLGESGIPEVAIEAYNDAADVQADADPECGIRWSLLAAIGRVESNHGRFGGAQLREDGYGTKPIRGIPLDGRPNVALIRDTDNGELDGDTTYDRAVGPMQFIPSTWRSVGQDANDDGRSDPNNIFDASQGAGAYLCAGGGALTDTASRARAVRRYNNADEYVRVVLSLAQMYETGRVEALPDLPVPPPARTPSAPRPSTPPTRPTPAPAPAPGSGPGPGPGSGPGSGGPTTTTPPAPTTTVPAPTTVPTPPTTVPDSPVTTVPGSPDTTVEPPETTLPPAPEDPPAAVGWAPAMREVVVDVIESGVCAEDEGGPDTVAADEGTDSVNADEAVLPEETTCEPPPPAGQTAAPAEPPVDD